MRLGCVFSDEVAAFDQSLSQMRSSFADSAVTRGLGEGMAKDFSAARIPGIGTFVKDTQIG
jgi:hypothetical protein